MAWVCRWVGTHALQLVLDGEVVVGGEVERCLELVEFVGGMGVTIKLTRRELLPLVTVAFIVEGGDVEDGIGHRTIPSQGCLPDRR